MMKTGHRLYTLGIGIGTIAIGWAFFPMLFTPGTQAHWSFLVLLATAVLFVSLGAVLQKRTFST
ncbi:hypothetical protein JCM19037_1012 [Geomicrobium sp. JCM 19037]|uniref:hypothetical protein n=2 Tax=unclassified Geomicrobium TaxID=2628951 RepID=UPI00045F1CE4|nr:hypothetical protein [Geomicrobium sp. JCM 19037]GAK02756.1 hypothetical protein JCM19037_1012 [Geomicrobium sp. JCM 19037]